MYKRIVIFFSVLMFCICTVILKLYSISQGTWLKEAATEQSSYVLNIAKLRGTIYDCKQKPITGIDKETIAAILPSMNTAGKISKLVEEKNMKSMVKLMSIGKPFAIKLSGDEITECEDIDVFKVPIRYSGDKLAPHIIGYINSSGKGVYGIEKAYNDYLSNSDSLISVRYKVDAIDRIIAGEKRIIEDKSYFQTKGVMLTIDSRLQKLSEEAARKYLKKGAVLVTEIPDCKIRASVSMPEYSQSAVADYLNDADSPLINRAFSSYNLGSVFKLVTAAAALESGISRDYLYNCAGKIELEDACFHCFNGRAHSDVDMNNAIAYSCNSYFVNLAQKFDYSNLLKLAEGFGLGRSLELAPGMESSAGKLPSIESLSNKKTLAVFSFGQGVLMATPVQIAGLINTIASGGEYSTPELVEGIVNENLELINKEQVTQKKRVISKETAQILKEFMKSSVSYGTSVKGKPVNLEAAAKTATAQTGIIDNGKEVIQAWYAGFYPYDDPKYCIIVFAENAVGGGESCGPVFRDIADYIYEKMPGALLS